MWHTALTAELAKFSSPPRNPYLASQPIHYYWTYFLIPAAVSETGPAPVHDVQTCLKVNALAHRPAPDVVGLHAGLGRDRPSDRGRLRGRPGPARGQLRGHSTRSSGCGRRGEAARRAEGHNIDAITAWHFEGPRIDGLPRCLWYVPQHSMAYSLGLIALTAAAAAGAAARWRRS